jgi:hypothetical protein
VLLTSSNIAFYSLNCILAGLDDRKGEEAIGLLTTTLTQLTTRTVTLHDSSSSFVDYSCLFHRDSLVPIGCPKSVLTYRPPLYTLTFVSHTFLPSYP